MVFFLSLSSLVHSVTDETRDDKDGHAAENAADNEPDVEIARLVAFTTIGLIVRGKWSTVIITTITITAINALCKIE